MTQITLNGKLSVITLKGREIPLKFYDNSPYCDLCHGQNYCPIPAGFLPDEIGCSIVYELRRSK